MNGKKISGSKKNGNENTNVCALCESRNANKRCGGCRERWYCSKQCQELHWKKGGHKQECQEFLQAAAEQARNDRLTNATHRIGGKTACDKHSDVCAICLGSPEMPVKLPCNHEFCRICIGALRSRGLKQLCPLCRKPLPPGADKLREQADRLYIQVERQLNRGMFSWSTLPSTCRRKIRNAVILFEECASQGDVDAQCNLGMIYANGHGVPLSYKRAVELYREAASQGHAQAQCNLGFMYDNGHGVTQDDIRAVEWYEKAANQGHADAQAILGFMYKNGLGVSQGLKQAVEWYSNAANQGHAIAQYNLGNMYYNGHGISKDYKRAVEWYWRAASQGDADAQYNLGMMFKNGHGVSQDYKRALEWCRKAADQGHAGAQCILGMMYNNGHDISHDFKRVVESYRKAANQGDTDAQKILGMMGV